MPRLELWDNLLQLFVTLLGGLYAMHLFRRSGKRSLAFLAAAQLSWALGLVYWTLYLSLRGYTPPEPNAANVAWSGGFLFFVSVTQWLTTPEERRYRPRLALLAPLLTLPFTVLWFVWGSVKSIGINLIWGAGMMWVGWHYFKGYLLFRTTCRPAYARYHLIVLLMLAFDEMVMLYPLLLNPFDYFRFNGYYFFDILTTLMLALQVPALKRAEGA